MAQLEEVKKILRSLLVSAPVRVTVSSLNKDYKLLEGNYIPYRELGYNSLIHLLHSIPDVLRVNGSHFESEVTLVITEKVAHVSDMVMKQKKPTKGRNAHAGRKSVICESLKKSPVNMTIANSFNNCSAKSMNYEFDASTSKANDDFLKHTIALSPFPKPILPRMIKFPTVYNMKQSNDMRTELNFNSKRRDIICDDINTLKKSSSSSDNYSETIESVDHSKSSSVDCSRVPSLSKHIPHHAHTEDEKTDTDCSVPSKFEKLKQFKLKNIKKATSSTEFKVTDLTISFGKAGVLSFENGNNKVPLDIQNKLRELIKSYPSGIQCSKLPYLFKNRYFKNFDYQSYGFDRLISLCIYLENIFYWEEDSDCDFKLYDKDNPPMKLTQITKDLSNEKLDPLFTPKTVDISKINAKRSKDWDIYENLIPSDSLKLGEVIMINSLDKYVIGGTMKIVISEIYNPSKFWIYLDDGHLNDMMNSIQRFYKENKAEYIIPEFLLDVGLYCIVNTLNEFQRALIVDLLPEIGGYVKVYLVDFGTLTNLPREKIWFLMKQFCDLPAQAVETSLAGIKPKNEGIWNEQSIIRFKDVVMSKQIFAKICSKEEQIVSVNISVISMPLRTLNDLLVQEGYALYLPNYKLEITSTNNMETSENDTNPRKKLIERIRRRNTMRFE